MAFNEDQSHARTGHAAENLAIIRRFAPNLLRQAKDSGLGVKNKRLRAAYDDNFRASVLQFAPVFIVRLPCGVTPAGGACPR